MHVIPPCRTTAAARAACCCPPSRWGSGTILVTRAAMRPWSSCCFTAFDHGITHFDLANNYGPEPGSAEKNLGRILHENFMPYRDELVVSTKAGTLPSGTAPMVTGAAASICWPAWTRACSGWGWTMWTSTTTTAWTPTPRWKRPWARWQPPCRAARPSTRACPTTTAKRWKRPRPS